MCSDIFKSAVEKFGVTNQIIKSIEEMAELQKELCKSWGKYEYKNLVNIIDEISDVEIMLSQLKIIFNCYWEVEAQKRVKTDRLRELVNNV